jgi:hypothetical protein
MIPNIVPVVFPRLIPPTLLDALTVSPAVAFSTRKLRAAYSGFALRVKRTGDNTQQDIGFVGTDLDTASLSSFVGSNDGSVTILYDQSGNGHDATGVGATAPLIIKTGVLKTRNGKAIIGQPVSGAGTCGWTFSGVSLSQPDSYGVVAAIASSGNFVDGATGSSSRQIIANTGTNWSIYAGAGPVNSSSASDSNIHGLVAVFNGSNSFLYVDSSAVINANAGTQAFPNPAGISFDASNGQTDGDYCEYIGGLSGSISATDLLTLTSSWHSYWGTP